MTGALLAAAWPRQWGVEWFPAKLLKEVVSGWVRQEAHGKRVPVLQQASHVQNGQRVDSARASRRGQVSCSHAQRAEGVLGGTTARAEEDDGNSQG